MSKLIDKFRKKGITEENKEIEKDKNFENSLLTSKKEDDNIKEILPKKEEIVRLKRHRSRISLMEQRRLMNTPKDGEYVYRIVNDTGDRIGQFYKAGYEIVDRNHEEIDIDGRIQDPSWKQSALSQPVGEGIIGYCMRIPREWWEEDQRAKYNLINAKENKMQQKEIVGIPNQNVIGDIKISSN